MVVETLDVKMVPFVYQGHPARKPVPATTMKETLLTGQTPNVKVSPLSSPREAQRTSVEGRKGWVYTSLLTAQVIAQGESNQEPGRHSLL